MISTRLTRMLDIRHPVVQAGMGGVARADLVAAVEGRHGRGDGCRATRINAGPGKSRRFGPEGHARESSRTTAPRR
jgi:NAD(P)H-dependent flavin oxidoreductase YrpB (nitropropane dioxygenase family)